MNSIHRVEAALHGLAFKACDSGVSANRVQGVGFGIQSTGRQVWEFRVRGSEGSEL